MGRSSTAQIGHNIELTDDDRTALSTYYERQVRIQEAEADKKAAEAKAARKLVNNTFALVKGELGYLRHQFEEVIELAGMTEDEFRLHEQARTKRLKTHGLAVGEQGELALGDTADDMARAYADGERAGLRGDDGVIPDYISPVCGQSWLQGWGNGQSTLAQRLGRAEAIIAEREEAARLAEEAEAEDEAEVDAEDEEFDEEAAARKLKRSGFMDRTEASAEAELAEA